MYNLKKYTQKDRYGNTITFEVERMQEATVPSMQEIPMYNHPGDPRGTDTVPAWLTPGEFVMNAEATRMYEPQIKAMNDHGRAIQKAQGGTIPEYAAEGKKVKANTDWVTGELLDGLKFSESSNRHYDKDGNLLTSKAGAVGAYQFIPKYATKGMGYGVAPFDVTSEEAQREAAGQYLRGMQQHYPDWDPTDVLRAYNWGPGNVKAYKAGTRTDIPEEALNYPGKVISNASKKPWVNRADGSEEPEIPMMEEVPMPVDGIVQDMAGFQESNPNPPAPELIPTLDSGLLAMDPSNEDYPPSYEGDNYLYNTNDEIYDRQMNAQLNKMSDLFEDNPRVVGKDGSPQEFSEEEMQAQRIAAIPEGGNEFGDIGQETKFTDRDKEKVQEGRERRYKEERDRQNAKQLYGQEVSEAEEKRLSELDMIRKGEIPQDRINIDPDAPGEDMNVTYEMEAVKSFADKYGEPTDEEFNKIDKQFEDLNKQEEDPSWLDSLVSKDMQASIGGFFSKMMNHALSDRALSSLVMNYVGSRAMGYDHGASFQFAAKKYGKQIEASQALEDKLYLSGKYKAPSIKRAMEKGDFGELVLAKSGATTDGTFKDYYKNGKKYRAQKFKIGDNVIYYAIDPETKQRVPIDNTFHEDGRLVKGTNEYRKMIGESKGSIAKIYEELEGRIGKIDGGDDPDKYKLGAGPETLSSNFINWALRKGFDPQDSRTTAIIGNAYRQAVADLESGKIKSITNLDSYLDRQHLYETTGSVDLFTTNLDKVQSNESAPKLVPGHLMQSLYNNVTNAASLLNTDSTGKKVPLESTRQAMFSHAMKEWKNLEEKNPAEFNKYVESAGKDRTAFYNYFTDNLNNLMKSYADANK
jgi:hypothetical protein